MSSTHLAILGGGNMGRALVAGLLRRGTRPEHIRVSDPLPATREALARDFGILATADNGEAVAGSRLVVLAVKPQMAQEVLTALAPRLAQKRPTLLSIAAGLRVAALSRWCGPEIPVVRAMPNRPALVGAGATGLYANESCPPDARAAAERVMSAVGAVVWVPTEEAIDAVTALSGSGPAYLFRVAELMAQAATDLGLPPDTARILAVATLHGAGEQAYASDGNLAQLRAEVTSKGGTTEAALRTLEAAGLAGIVTAAVQAAAARAKELGEQLGGTLSEP
jgi:pyrroline-5-carboxylate reductase